jgi:hypothetical protein
LKDLQADYEKQIQIRDQEIQALQEKLDALSSADLMDQKYQDRLALIKKIHDEQLTSLKQQITLREQELETTLEKFKREQQHHETLIREEATAKERARAEKIIKKIEKVKMQEISIAKSDNRREVEVIKKQVADLVK